MKKFVLFAAAALIAPVSQAQAAELIGDTITCQQSGSGSSFNCNPFQADVSGGTEFFLRNGSQNVIGLNFVGNGLNIRNVSGGPLLLFSTVVQLNNISQLFSEARLSSTNIFGFGENDVAINNGILSLDFRNTVWGSNDTASIRLTATSAVPEPSTWMMLILGFAAVGAALRLQRNRGSRATFGDQFSVVPATT
jgi:opacity protein-like surface antigen